MERRCKLNEGCFFLEERGKDTENSRSNTRDGKIFSQILRLNF